MGQCMSSGAASQSTRLGASAAPSKDTALVLMPSGEMREYPRPTTASRVLEDATASSSESDWFLCDADGMGFEGAVPALRPADSLRPGQIYFVLPAAARRKGLTRQEVAALAVRASAALYSRAVVSAPGKRRRGAVVAPLVFAPLPEVEEDERREEAFAAACKAAAAPPVRRPAPRVWSGKRLERFASDLTAIPECEATSE